MLENTTVVMLCVSLRTHSLICTVAKQLHTLRGKQQFTLISTCCRKRSNTATIFCKLLRLQHLKLTLIWLSVLNLFSVISAAHPRFFNQLYAGMEPYSMVASFIVEALKPSLWVTHFIVTYSKSHLIVLNQSLKSCKWSNMWFSSVTHTRWLQSLHWWRMLCWGRWWRLSAGRKEEMESSMQVNNHCQKLIFGPLLLWQPLFFFFCYFIPSNTECDICRSLCINAPLL